jgi:tetratricopeptide (TPR) repeat protein
MGVLLPFLSLVAANAALCWLQIGDDSRLVIRSLRCPNGVSHFNPQADAAFALLELRGPEPRGFLLPKPEDTFRVVVVGASSVQGYPFASELSFSRHLELVLARQFPDKRVEVLNAGIVGLGTTPVVDVVNGALDVSPDAVVVYAGHNEFYGVGGVASNAPLSRWTIRARHFRLVQVLSGLMAPDDADASELITRLPREVAVPPDSPFVASAQRQYRRNLEAMAASCSRAGVPLVLCGAVCNLRDQSPLRTWSTSAQDDRAEGSPAAFDAHAVELIGNRSWQEARGMLQAAIDDEPRNAVLHYRLAQCLEQMGETEAAAAEYQLACDFDECRYRAPSSFREIAADVARGGQPDAVYYVDLASEFTRAAEFAAPGHDLFIDHVHLTVEGNWLVAQTLGRSLVEQVAQESWREGAIPSDFERDEWLGLMTEDRVVSYTLGWMLTTVSPLDQAVDVERHRESLQAKIDYYTQQLTSDDAACFASLDPNTRVDDLVDGLGRAYLDQGLTHHAVDLFERGKRRRPWMPNSFVFAAACYEKMGRRQAAMDNLEQSYHTTMPETLPIRALQRDVARRLGLPLEPGS